MEGHHAHVSPAMFSTSRVHASQEAPLYLLPLYSPQRAHGFGGVAGAGGGDGRGGCVGGSGGRIPRAGQLDVRKTHAEQLPSAGPLPSEAAGRHCWLSAHHPQYPDTPHALSTALAVVAPAQILHALGGSVGGAGGGDGGKVTAAAAAHGRGMVGQPAMGAQPPRWLS